VHRFVLVPVPLGLVFTLLAAACSSPPPKSAAEPTSRGQADDWKRSATWLYATSDATSGPPAECEHVRTRLQEELRCRGPLCQYGAEVAQEWLQKCKKLMPAAVEEVSGLEATLRDQMEREPSACSTEFQRFIKDGCEAKDCLEAAQSWATKCAEKEAGPLCVAMLERTVERALGPEERVHLDSRSCSSLATHLKQAARCADEPACKEILPEAEAYRTRCNTDELKPDLGTALAVASILIGAARDPAAVPILRSAEPVAGAAFPLALADGSGAILEVCHRPVFERKDYLEARARCPSGRLSVARAFTADDGSRVLRIGQLLLPEQPSFTSLYPSLELPGELEELTKLHLTEVKSDLDAALQAPAVTPLVAFADKYAEWLERSSSVRDGVQSSDSKLAPLLRKLAEAKVAAMRTTKDTGAQRGVLERARHRAFADIGLDGTFQPGAATRASWVDTAKLWPEATRDAAAALAPLEAAAKKGGRPKGATRDAELEAARAHATACAAATHTRQDAERDLLTCAFESCTEERKTELSERWQKAHNDALSALRELDLALGAMESSLEQSPLASEAGCVRPR